MDREDTLLSYIQGRLSASDQAAFEAEIDRSPDLRAEVAALRAARGVMDHDSKGAEPGRTAGWNRLSRAIDREAGPANENRPIRFSILQAACIAAAALVGVEVMQRVFVPSVPQGYAPASIAANAPVLQVVFAPQADIAAISDLLFDLGGTIVSGPGAMNIYNVAFADEKTRDAARGALVAQSELVEEIFEP